MKAIKNFIFLIMSSLYIKNQKTFELGQDQVIERSFEETQRKEKRKQRLYQTRKWTKKKTYRQKNFSLKGTNSKDNRYSNQRKIRRMFRNS